MAVYDSTDHKLGDYLLGKATGYAGSVYSSLGAEHFRYEQKQRDQNLSMRYTPGSSGPGILDEAFQSAGDFASEWTETIVDYVASVFKWVPSWVGMVLKVLCVFAFLTGGVNYGFTGWGLLFVTGTGWFAPRIFSGLLQLTVYLSLTLLYLSFVVLVAASGVGAVIGVFYGLAVLFA
ncbi:hypothetical protein [Gimesia sp.]|uniref:hypothetical protein n=1 Tax=Gimesia sp. TaxID=2024833 RepID=UPI003A8EAF78